MSISIFTDPSKLPHRSQPKPVFDKNMGDYFRQLGDYNSELNSFGAQFQAFAAGGAYAFPYIFDSATVDADPGAGKLRLSSTAQSGATALRLDSNTAGGASILGLLDAIQAVTSTIKGAVRIVKAADPASWLVFDVATVSGGAGYRNLALTHRASSGPNPFSNGDQVMVFIDRNGDSGTIPGATDLIVRMNIDSPVAVASLATVFDTAHDWYLIDIPHIQSGGRVVFEFCSDGLPVNTASYLTNVPNSTATTTLGTSMGLSLGTITDSVKIAGLLQVRGVNTDLAKTVIWDGSFWRASTGMTGIANRCSLETGQAVSGFRIRAENGAQISSGLIRVYGVRKA